MNQRNQVLWLWKGVATHLVASRVLAGMILACVISALSGEIAHGIEGPRATFFGDYGASTLPPGRHPLRAELELVAGDKMPVAYFMDRVPDDLDLPAVSGSVTDIMVAKVRVKQAPSFLGGRDRSGERPKDLPKDILFTRVEIVDVRKGRAAVGQVFDVRLGLRGDERRFSYPLTPDQLSREYMVVIYLDVADGLRRLVPFSITELQYSQWEAEQSAYTRMRGMPGFRE